MGFSPSSVGLGGERISGRFLEDRNGCPHKGIDITSSMVPKSFQCGIFGRVTFTGGSYKTIAVQPMDGSAIHMQYIHCSQINVSNGQIVAPWTVIGVTGDTAPGGTGITGIHLHLQVQIPGSGEACWALSGNSRNFSNPETHPTPDLMRGSWFVVSNWSLPGYAISDRSEIGISGSAIGSRVIQQRIRTVTGGNGCVTTIRMQWPNGSISSHGTNSITISSPAGNAGYVNDGCAVGGSPNAQAGSVEGLVLTSPSTLSSPEGTMTRMGLFGDDIVLSYGFRLVDEEAFAGTPAADVIAGQGQHILDYNPFGFDPYGTSLALTNFPVDAMLGVDEKERVE